MMDNVFPWRFQSAAGGPEADVPPLKFPVLCQLYSYSHCSLWNPQHLNKSNPTYPKLISNRCLRDTYSKTCRWPTGWVSEERLGGGSEAWGCSPQCLDTARLNWCHRGWARDSRPGDWDRRAAPHRVDLQFNNIKEKHIWVCVLWGHSVILSLPWPEKLEIHRSCPKSEKKKDSSFSRQWTHNFIIVKYQCKALYLKKNTHTHTQKPLILMFFEWC